MPDIREELFQYNPWWEGEYKLDLIPRDAYLQFLKSNLSNKDIILITGLRRIGKTSIMKLFISNILSTTEPKHILYLSLDSLPLEPYSISEILRTYRKIHNLPLDARLYLFFDEVGYRKDIHQQLKNLYDQQNVKIFASSSLTTILRDTKALLTGRSRVLEVLPLTFSEFMHFKGLKAKPSETYLLESYFEHYMQIGGVPEYVLSEDVSYLDNLIEGIIYKDIISCFGLRDMSGVKNFFRLLMERAGKQVSINKIAKIMGISPDTARRFLDYFSLTYLIYSIERCGKLNERLRAPKKLYAADVGIKNYLTGYRDKGALFENLVFLQIKQHHPCYIYQNGMEIDFYFNNTAMEVKYNREIEGKQKKFFMDFKAKEKKIVNNLDDYLKLAIV